METTQMPICQWKDYNIINALEYYSVIKRNKVLIWYNMHEPSMQSFKFIDKYKVHTLFPLHKISRGGKSVET